MINKQKVTEEIKRKWYNWAKISQSNGALYEDSNYTWSKPYTKIEK